MPPRTNQPQVTRADATIVPPTVAQKSKERFPAVQVLESVAKLLAIGVGFLYVSGVLMVNLYLLQFGASDFAVLRTRYALSGVIVTITFLLFSASGIYIGYSEKTSTLVGTALSGLPMLAYSILVLSLPIPGEAILSGTEVFWKGAPTSMLSQLAALGVAHWRKKLQRERRFEPLAVIVGLLTFAFVAAVPFSAYEVYPRIPAQFGGGRTIRARVAISQESKDQLASLGVATSPESALSFPLDIVHDSETFLVLRTNRSTVQVERKAITGVWVADSLTHDPPRKLPTPKPNDNETSDDVRKRHARLANVEIALTSWEFMELSLWTDRVFSLQKDPSKRTAMVTDLFERLEAVLKTEKCGKECERLTRDLYAACQQ